MEGVLWTRDSRSKLLRGWHKRYFVLSDAGMLYEYAPNAKKKELLRRASLAVSTTSSLDENHGMHGMILRRELDVQSATVKTLPFAIVGKHNAFQVTTVTEAPSVKLVLRARQADDVQMWSCALRAAAVKRTIPRHLWSISAGQACDSMRLEKALESDFLEVHMPQRADMAHLSSVYEWIHERCVKTSQNVTVASVDIPRGSLLVSANGVLLQTLTPVEVKKMLLESTGPLPVSLRFLRCPAKVGILRAQLDTSPFTQLKALAKYRNASRMDWKEQVVDLSGNLLTCQRKRHASHLKLRTSNTRGHRTPSKTKRVVSLSSGSLVRPVHELVCDRKFCFLVTEQGHSMLFQARSEVDRRAWTDAIQRAITIAEGLVPGGALAQGSFDLEALQLQSSLNMRHLEQAFQGMDKEREGTELDVANDSSEEEDASPVEALVPRLSLSEDWSRATQSTASLPETELIEMLQELQCHGRFVEALQLMQQNTQWRSTYWQQIFHWALSPVQSDYERRTLFQQLTQAPLVKEDETQVQKDIPRTIKWLAGSAGAPELKATEQVVRLELLDQVLHAFLSSCSLDVRTDEAPGIQSPSESVGFYMQGMNGLAFILLGVLENDPVDAFRFLRGIVACILPHVFGICCDGTGRDHFDLFRSLVEVGDVLQEVTRLHVPQFHAAVERAGLPVCLLAYKWFPTLFSDVTLTASHSQLRFDTLLCCWDVCLLLGVEGMFCVALALCSTAEEDVLALRASGNAAGSSTELVSATVGQSLASLTPEDLITSVCEVLELCSHPVLLKLRNAHRRRLKLGISSASNGFDTSRTLLDRSVLKKPFDVRPPMTVTDLDSGKVFQISISGNMLVPTVEPH